MSPIEGPFPALPRLRVLAAGLATTVILGGAVASEEALAASCSGADAKPTQAGQAKIARATLCLLNGERRSRALHPLRQSAPLAAAARGHSRDMVRRRYFAHTAPGGATVVRRIRQSGYLSPAKKWTVGENLGWGSRSEGSPRAIVRAWMHSPPHRKAILTASYRDAGIGVASGVPRAAAGSGATYTVDFGVTR
jgi:uncharacterized protein YkwD